MLFDLLFGLVLLAMAGLGAWRGAVPSGAGLVGLLGGYGGGLLGAVHGAGWVERTLVVSPLLAPAVAGTLGFVLVWLVVSSAGDLLVAWDEERVDGFARGSFDRGLGGVFGLARGSLVVVLLAVLVSWLDAARDLGAVEGLAALPETESSAVTEATGDLVESVVSSALSDAGAAGEIAARIAARPGKTLGSVQSILEDPRIEGLFSDRLFWTLIQNDSIDYAMNRRAMRSLILDPEVRGRFADLGLVEDAAREDPEAFKRTLATVFSDVAPKVARLHRDPEIQALAEDPEIQQLVQSGDTLALIAHPRMKRIVDRVSREL
ncbi:MAG: CvpA family protein [Myxococcota bacterium]